MLGRWAVAVKVLKSARTNPALSEFKKEVTIFSLSLLQSLFSSSLPHLLYLYPSHSLLGARVMSRETLPTAAWSPFFAAAATLPLSFPIFSHSSPPSPLYPPSPSSSPSQVDVQRNLRHPTMVLLIGCCHNPPSLVYEYMAQGSLYDRLICDGGTPPLPWNVRFDIFEHTCRALIHLHKRYVLRRLQMVRHL